MIVLSALYKPRLNFPFLLKLALIISDILYPYHSQPSGNMVNIGSVTPRMWRWRPLNPMCCTECPAMLVDVRPRSSSAGPSLTPSPAGQRYLSASQERWLAAV